MSRQWGLWLGALVAVAVIAGCASTPPAGDLDRLQARAEYERGLEFLRDRQPGLALSALQQAVSLDPTAPLYWNALGLLFLELRRPDLALQEFTRATALDGGYAEAHLNTGIALAESGRWSEAEAAYRRAVALPTLPAPQVAYQDLGLALYHLGRYQEAEAALRFAIGLDPEMQGAYYNLGLVLLAGERKDEALAVLRRARDMAPESPFGRAAVERLGALGQGK